MRIICATFLGRLRVEPDFPFRAATFQFIGAPLFNDQTCALPMDLSKIPTGVNPPWDLTAVIEIPQGGEPVKYEIDKESGALMVDRFLHTAMFYPANYGFIPHTLADDGDPADIMVVGLTPVVPGAIIRCRPIGTLMMVDEAGSRRKDPGRADGQAAPLLHGRALVAGPADHPDRADLPTSSSTTRTWKRASR